MTRLCGRWMVLVFVGAMTTACAAKETRVDDAPWAFGRTCTSTSMSEDGNRTVARVERDAHGRVTRFEVHHDEMIGSEFSGFRRVYQSDGTMVETHVEANQDESGTSVTTYRRDAARRVVEVTDRSSRTLLRYDGRGRLAEMRDVLRRRVTRIDRPDDLHIEVSSGPEGEALVRHQRVTLDGRGRVLEILNLPGRAGSGDRTVLVRNDAGHVTEIVQDGPELEVTRERRSLDARGREVSSTWDYLDDGVVDSRTTTRYDRAYGDYPCGPDAMRRPIHPIDW